MSVKVSTLVMGVCLVFGGAFALVAPQSAMAQQKDAKTVNPKVGAALQASMAAAQKKQYDVALAKIKEAEAEKKNSFEQFKINETLSYIYNLQKNYPGLAGIYEKQLEMPQFLTPEQSQVFQKSLTSLYFSSQQYAKSIEYGKRWLQEKPNDPEVTGMVASAYYMTKDYKLCKETLAGAISAAEKAGSKPTEPWLQTTRACAAGINDEATVAQTDEKLSRYYPKPEYWSRYVRSASRNEKSDLASFHWYRLKEDVGALKELKDADDLTTYATQAMTDYGSPGEAVRVLEEGFNKRILGQDEKRKMRQQNTLNKAKEAAAASKAQWTAMATAAESDPTGQKSADLGMAYFGVEQYDQAISYLEKGLKKAGVKEPAHVKLTLAIAQLKKGQRESARAAFKSLSSDPVLGKVAASWLVRSYN